MLSRMIRVTAGLLFALRLLALRQGQGAAADINDGSVQFAPSPSRF